MLKGIGKIRAKIRRAAATHVKVGFFKDSTYKDGTSVAQVAMWNEYGTSKTPSRPFMRTAVSENKDKWADSIRRECFEYFTGNKSASSLGKATGELMKADIMASIDSNMPPPNAKGTYKRKASRVVDKGGVPIPGESGTKQTLIDTGVMLKNVKVKVGKRVQVHEHDYALFPERMNGE